MKSQISSQETRNALKGLLETLWATKDVYGLCKVYFRVELTEGEEKIVSAVAFDEHPRVVICCMTRYGKSYSVALGILLWIVSHPNKRIIIIAPTSEKTSIIRNYLSYFVTRSNFFMSQLDIDKSGVERIRKEVSRNRMTWKNGVEMRTLSAEGKGEALMGFGADKIIVDETCDIDFEVYRSKITRMLGDHPESSTYVEIGNPWHRDNQMYQHWTDPTWWKVHIDWEEALTEGRITQQFVDEQRSILTDREFKVLYEAEFPEESEDQLIPYSWIMRAVREPTPEELKELETARNVLGTDVAHGGNDSTVHTWGKTNGIIYYAQNGQEYQGILTSETTKVEEQILLINRDFKLDRMTIDAGGIGGGVKDRMLKRKTLGEFTSSVIGYEGGHSSSADAKRKTQEKKEVRTRFLNIKSEAYWKLRTLFEESRIIISPSLAKKYPLYTSQLTKMKWDVTSAEKIIILDPGMAEGDTAEKKSPDFADSLCYFCFEGTKPSLVFGSLNVA